MLKGIFQGFLLLLTIEINFLLSPIDFYLSYFGLFNSKMIAFLPTPLMNLIQFNSIALHSRNTVNLEIKNTYL
jgi:hypothetical protein